MHLWSALQQEFSLPEHKPSINELWALLVFYLKLKCLNICINIYMHAQSIGLSIVPQCRHIQCILLITIQYSSDCVPRYIIYAMPSCNSPDKSQEELRIQSNEGFRKFKNLNLEYFEYLCDVSVCLSFEQEVSVNAKD